MPLTYREEFEAAVLSLPADRAPENPAAEAYIEALDEAGAIKGWARSFQDPAPLWLEAWFEGERLGAGLAASFRHDLLLAGIGHGHYGFQFHISGLGGRQGVLRLRVACSDAILAEKQVRARGESSAARTVESLLDPTAGWSLAQVTAHCETLDLAQNLAAQGGRRFVAGVHRFLLGRWPRDDEYGEFHREFRLGRLTAGDYFILIAGSAEAKNRRVSLVSPHHPEFPFTLRASDKRSAADETAGIPKVVDAATGLPQARLLSPRWEEDCDQLHFDEHTRRLLCHPPPRGYALAKIDNLPARGTVRAQVRVSVGNARSHPIDFAFIALPGDDSDLAILALLEGADPRGAIWRTASFGADRILQAECAAHGSGATLYLATRMAAGSRDHYHAWAHFFNLVVGSAPVDVTRDHWTADRATAACRVAMPVKMHA